MTLTRRDRDDWRATLAAGFGTSLVCGVSLSETESDGALAAVLVGLVAIVLGGGRHARVWWRHLGSPRPPAREPPSLDAAAGLEFLAAALVAGALLLWAIAPDGLTAREQRAAAVLAAGTLTAVVLFALDPAWRRARRAHRSRLPGGP